MTGHWRGASLRLLAVCALVAVAWMHGATVPSSAVCVSHEAPTSSTSMAPAAPGHSHDAGSHSARSMPGAELNHSAPIALLHVSPSEDMAPHGLMACVAILVALIALTAPGFGRLRPSLRMADQWRARLPILAWPRPPDLMVLSVLRT
jgi:hypothetical protein